MTAPTREGLVGDDAAEGPHDIKTCQPWCTNSCIPLNGDIQNECATCHKSDGMRCYPNAHGWPRTDSQRACPVLRAHQSKRILPTAQRAWPELGEKPHPAVYSVRQKSVAELGPLAWVAAEHSIAAAQCTHTDSGGSCTHVGPDSTCFLLRVANATLAKRLFASEGSVGSPLRSLRAVNHLPGMKWVDGDAWRRQRRLLERHVLTDAIKRQRAEAVAPATASCLLTKLTHAVGDPAVASRVDAAEAARGCMARMLVHAVMGTGWDGVGELAVALVESERCSNCPHQEKHAEVRGECDAFNIAVRSEVNRRITKATAGDSARLGGACATDGGAALLDRMLSLTTECGLRADSDEGVLSVDEIVWNVVSFLSAGWETSTMTMFNTLWLVAAEGTTTRLAGLQHQLREEAAAGVDDFAQRVVTETLRWRPPIPAHGAEVVGSDLVAHVGNDVYTLPVGSVVEFSVLAAHELPPVGSLLDGWDPWATTGVREHAGGLGARHCPGGKIARLGIAKVLGMLLANRSVSIAEPRAHHVDKYLQSFRSALPSDLCDLCWRPLPLELRLMPRSAVPARMRGDKDET